MVNLFLQVLNMSFNGSVVILFILLIRILLKKAPKVFSYALWTVVLFRLICPFAIESMLSLLPIKANPISPDILYQTKPQIDTGVEVIDRVVSGSLPAATPMTSVNPLQILVAIGSIVWLVGMGLLSLYSFISLLQLLKKLDKAMNISDNIYISNMIDTPFVMGVLRPKIFLPSKLKEKEKQYILLHEKTHIQRFDHMFKLVGFFILCIHWFNPLVWLSFFLFNRDMEMSCDEAVLNRLGTQMKKEYSTSLLSLSTGRTILGGAPLAFGEGETKSRIINILNYKKPKHWIVVAALVTLLIVSIGLMTNPISTEKPSDYAKRLWEQRTAYVGNNSAVGNILSNLQLPDGVDYVGFKLDTKEPPYAITVNFKTDTATRNYYTGALQEAPFQINACILFSLIENVEYINFSLDDDIHAPYSLQYTVDWAESIVGAELLEESNTLDKFSQLLIRINEHVSSAYSIIKSETPAQQGGLTFFVKPDEPAQVIGEVAANVWLKTYMEDSTSPKERINYYKIKEVTVISGTPKEGQTWQDMKYHYVVRINYDITTASDEYFAPGDGVSGKGTFESLFRELLVKSLGGGNHDIIEVGTGGGEQEFANI